MTTAVSATAVLEIEDLVTHIRRRGRAPVRAVDGVSLRLEPGQMLGLVGESGCGKTMTGLSVLKLLPPGGRVISGRIAVNGRDVVPLDEAGMRRIRGDEVAMIFQDPMTALNPTMTIGGQIVEAVRAHRRVDRREALDRAAAVLDEVGLPRPRERLGDYPHQLSGGQRQRVAIAMAIACEPDVLIADEPTTALDVTIQAQILRLLDDLRMRRRMAVVLITHDMGVIAGHADRVAVMYAGKIVEEADVTTLFVELRHPYTEALLGSIPRLDQDTEEPLDTIAGLPPDLANPPPACRFSPRCRYVTERCRTEEPSLELDRTTEAHRFACHHPVGRGRGGAADRVTR